MFELFAEATAQAPPAAGTEPSAAPVPAVDARAAAELLDLITATSRIDAWSESIRSMLIAMLYQRTLAEHRRFGLVAHADGWGTAAGASHGFDDVALTRAEIAANLSLELGQSLPVADRAVTTALGLARTPVARQALGAGRMDPPQARSLMAELEHVPDPELCREVAAALTTDPQIPGADEVLVRELRESRKRLWELPPAEIRAIVRREVAEREPALAAERSRRERADRHLRYHPLRDGMAELVLHGPAEPFTGVRIEPWRFSSDRNRSRCRPWSGPGSPRSTPAASTG